MKKFATLFVLLSGALWGSMGIFVRQYNANGLQTIEIVAIRAIVTVVLLLLFLLCFDRKLLRIRLRDIWIFLGTGILSIIFFNFCYFKAITLTSLSAAAVLLYTAPAIVMLFSRVLFGERLSRRKLLSLVITFAGCVLVTGVIGEAKQMTPIGILAGLGAGLGYALYSIFSRYALERGYHSLTITFYTFLFAAVAILPFADMKDVLRVSGSSGGMIAFTVIFGLVSTVLPYILYTKGLTGMENGKASILASVEPVVATLLGWLFFHETLGWNGALGAAMVLLAVVLCNLGTQRAEGVENS